MSNKSLKKVKEVTIITSEGEEKVFKVKKMPLGRYAQAIEELEKIPELVGQIATMETEDIFKQLPKMLATSFEDVVGVLSIATGIDKTFLQEEVDLEEAIELVHAVIEVNNFFALGRKLQEMFPGAQGIFQDIMEAGMDGYKKSLPGSGSGGSASAMSLGTTTLTK